MGIFKIDWVMAGMKTVTFIVILERNHDILTLICELFVCFEKRFGHYHDLCENLTFKQVLHQLYTTFVWLHFSTWWPMITLTCRYFGHRALVIIFINVGYTVHSNHWLCLCLDSMFCSSISSSPYSWKHSYLTWSVTSSMTPRSIIYLVPNIHEKDNRISFEFCRSAK